MATYWDTLDERLDVLTVQADEYFRPAPTKAGNGL
jgi:hypothetical protein